MRTSRNDEGTDRPRGARVRDRARCLRPRPRRTDARRRMVTLTSFGVVTMLLAIVAVIVSEDGNEPPRSATVSDAGVPGTSARSQGPIRCPVSLPPSRSPCRPGGRPGTRSGGPAGEGSRRSPAGDREPRSASRSSTSDASIRTRCRRMPRSIVRALRPGSDGRSGTTRRAWSLACAIGWSATGSTGGRRRSWHGC